MPLPTVSPLCPPGSKAKPGAKPDQVEGANHQAPNHVTPGATGAQAQETNGKINWLDVKTNFVQQYYYYYY